MKNPKNPTLNQKKRIREKRLNPNNWQVIKDNSEIFEIIHRVTKKIKTYKVS